MEKNTIDPVIINVQIDESGHEISSFIINPDYEDIEQSKPKQNKTFWEKIKSWFTSGNVKPFVQINDLNNSKDEPGLNKPKSALEMGIKIEF